MFLTSTSIFLDCYISTHDDPTRGLCARPQLLIAASTADAINSTDFGLLGEQSSPKWEIPCPGRQWTTVQNSTPLALSSAEKSVTALTHTKQTNKQTNKNSN